MDGANAIQKRSSMHMRARTHDSELTQLESTSDVGQLYPDDKAASGAQEMDEEFWVSASASQMAQHISLNGPKTQFVQEQEAGINTGEKTQDKMTRHYIDQIDQLAPGLSDEMTSQYMAV